MGKAILVLIDACDFDIAKEYLGYAEHMTERNLCAKYRVTTELPAMSRVNYETLMTGQPPSKHGILNNCMVRRSRCENLFSLSKKNGRVTAAAAYMWFSELYSRAPFSSLDDRLQLEKPSGDIDHGIFYFEDPYPDNHLFADAEFLRKTYNPDFMVVHPMGMDYRGHQGGCDSKEYREACVLMDILISTSMPAWREAGYDVIVTSDHGMDSYGIHSGNAYAQRTVPLYLFADAFKPGDFTATPISQLNVAPLVCSLLGMEKGGAMIEPSDIGKRS